MTVYEFPNRTVNIDEYPPAPVAWFINTIDMACYVLQCSNWREQMGVKQGDWLSHHVPGIRASMEPYLTYNDYLESNPSDTPYSWESLYKFAFETPSTFLAELTDPTTLGIVLILVLLIRAIKAVIMPLFSSMGRQLGRRTHGTEWEKENEVRIVKFGEYVYRLCFHSGIAAVGLWYFMDQEWWAREGFSFVGTRAIFEGFPNQPMMPGLAWYYIVQSAYNIDAMFSLLVISFDFGLQNPFGPKGMQLPLRITWSKDVRGDFAEMMVHHVATNLLIMGSSHCRLTRCGSMVFLIHDVSDVPVDLSKLANFLKWKVTTVAFFFTMTLVWFVTRLYVLPVVIFGAALTESQYLLADGLPVMLYICYKHFFYCLLSVLVLLHATWFLMFLRMFATFVNKNECHDYSEHKKGEKQE